MKVLVLGMSCPNLAYMQQIMIRFLWDWLWWVWKILTLDGDINYTDEEIKEKEARVGEGMHG
jgi:hypothetical protein